MYTRYLIFIVLLGFPGFTSFGQFNSHLPKQESFNPDLIIQVGAFLRRSNAIAMKDKLSDILDKPVFIVTDVEFFKVQIAGFSGEEEMGKFYSTLAFLGIKDFWKLPAKKLEEIKQQTVVQPDTAIKSVSENTAFPVVAEKTPSVSQHTVILQIAVFHNKSEALKTQKNIATKLNLPVQIVQEWGYYKVFVTGFHSSEEANKYFNAIVQLGYSNISLIEN
jgi:uncharacterized protein YutD